MGARPGVAGCRGRAGCRGEAPKPSAPVQMAVARAGRYPGAGVVGPRALSPSRPAATGSVFSRSFPLDLKICSYNGSAPGVVPLGQEGPVLAPGAGSDCLGDASPIAPRLEDAHILSEDPLEPFESLATGREAARRAGRGGAGIGAAAGRTGSCPPPPARPWPALPRAGGEAAPGPSRSPPGDGGGLLQRPRRAGSPGRAGADPRPRRVPPAPASSALPPFPPFPAP